MELAILIVATATGQEVNWWS